jgi:glycosyltransferase involved in cell wall biosynthesis
MKVALFISNQTPEVGGGYTFESQLLDVLLQLYPESRHTFVLFSSDAEGVDRILSKSLQVVPIRLDLQARIKLKVSVVVRAILRKLRYPRSKLTLAGWYEKHLLNLLKINQIDLILSFTPSCPTLDYPFITTVWDLQHRLQPYFPEVSLGGEWENRENTYTKILRRAAFIITGTVTGKAEIERFYQVPADRIKVIPFFTPQLGSTKSLSDRDVTTKYNLPDRYLFYPAQFWPHKNHINLLLAIKCLYDKYNLEIPLVLVGADKGNQSYVRAMVKDLDLSKQVYLLDFVPQAEMAPLYRNAFALIFLTFFGPDNLPPLEAMALGCPAIVSNVSGAKEQLGDAALLVDPKQPEEIALAIKSLVEDSLLRQSLIERGLIRANQWTATDYLNQIFSVIDDFEAIRRCWQ